VYVTLLLASVSFSIYFSTRSTSRDRIVPRSRGHHHGAPHQAATRRPRAAAPQVEGKKRRKARRFLGEGDRKDKNADVARFHLPTRPRRKRHGIARTAARPQLRTPSAAVLRCLCRRSVFCRFQRTTQHTATSILKRQLCQPQQPRATRSRCARRRCMPSGSIFQSSSALSSRLPTVKHTVLPQVPHVRVSSRRATPPHACLHTLTSPARLLCHLQHVQTPRPVMHALS
jgi:hypothetical protein